ncbi:MAG: DUF3857 domain-containing protein [Bacteroidales bacterium]|nr:MAG: DUF3857 domain-containing protein [Bacteroidales bacterium]
MNSKYIIGLILLIFTACSAPLTDEQKNADAVYLKQVKEYTLNPDGSYSYHYYHKLQYNTYQAINRFYGETFVVYNPQYQTLKVNKSETKMADGKKVKSPENAFNEVLPFSAADAPAYNHLREMVITHVGLERGAVVELDYEIQTKHGFMPFFFDRVNLCESSPVKQVEVIVRIPKGEKLNFSLLNQPQGITSQSKTIGEYEVYTWKSDNLCAYSHEPLQAEGQTAYPFLTFSTQDFATVFNFLKGKLTNTFVPDEESKNLLKNASTGWDKINLIQNYVVLNINTYGVSPQLTGYRYRTPEEVWQCNGGTEGEKAVLLTAMLKIAGFNAQTVIAGYSHSFNKEVGFPGSFDRYWVKVEFEGETRILSAIDDHAAIPGQRITIALADDISQFNFENQAKPFFKALLNANINLTNDVKLSGTGNLFLNRFESDKGLLTGIPTSSFTSSKTCNAKDSVTHSIVFTNPNLAERVDGYFILNLPKIAQGIASVGIGELPLSRQTTIELPFSFDETYSYTFTLSAGIKIIAPLKKAVVENSLGYCSIEGVEKDGTVIITRKINLNRSSIAPENYTEFRQIMTLWADKNLNKVAIRVE